MGNAKRLRIGLSHRRFFNPTLNLLMIVWLSKNLLGIHKTKRLEGFRLLSKNFLQMISD
jgi:hypothetical protein